jgi:uncharacterized membrane protein YvbJ
MKSADEKYCSHCGEIIKKEAEICPKCGVRQKYSINYQNLNNNSKKSNETALIILNWASIIFFPLGILVPIVLFTTTKNPNIKKHAKILLIIYGVLFLMGFLLFIFGTTTYQTSSIQ